MFTGIVEELGRVTAITHLGDSARLDIRGPVVTQDAKHGDSIAVNGVCLTVTETGAGSFSTDVMAQTLAHSSVGALVVGSPVNLERAVRSDGRFGGHVVQGHVDTTAALLRREPGERWDVLTFAMPGEVARYVVARGSVCVDGVSLEEERVARALVCDSLAAGWAAFTGGQYTDALEPFAIAAEGGHPIAEYALGLMELTGQGTEVKVESALALLERAAADRFDLISDAAAKRIARHHMSLDGKTLDFASAYVWSKIALELMPQDDSERATFEAIAASFVTSASTDQLNMLSATIDEWLATEPAGHPDCTEAASASEVPVSEAPASGSDAPVSATDDVPPEPDSVNGHDRSPKTDEGSVPQLAGTDPGLIATD